MLVYMTKPIIKKIRHGFRSIVKSSLLACLTTGF